MAVLKEMLDELIVYIIGNFKQVATIVVIIMSILFGISGFLALKILKSIKEDEAKKEKITLIKKKSKKID